MTFPFACHECGHRNHAEYSWCGRSTHCQGCGATVVVPAPREGKGDGSAEPPVSTDKVKFACPNCGRKFSTQARLAGKKIRCGGCNQKLAIPALLTAPPPASASAPTPAPKPKAAPPAPLALDFDDVDDTTFRPSRSPSRGEPVERVLPSRAEAMASLSASASAAAEEKAKKGKKKKRRKRSSGGLEMNDVVTMLGAAVVGVVLVVGLAWAAPGTRFPMGGLLCLGGFIVYLLGVYGFSKVANEEGTIYGLMCRFVPLYKWYYLITRWDEMKGHFAFYAVGLMMLMPGVVLLKFSGIEDDGTTAALFLPGIIAGGGGEDSGEAVEESEDQAAARMLADKSASAEARAWLAADARTHRVWKGDRALFRKLVDDLYAAGAANVSCVDLIKESNFEVMAMLAVTLPSEPAARREVFDVHNAFWRSYLGGEDPDELGDFLARDRKQKYILLNFDL